MIASDNRLALPVGHRFGEYRIVKVLGQGGFGITYLAHDSQLNCDVAVKELLPRDSATRVDGVTVMPKRPSDAESFAWAKERFINEARILASLKHENIVHVHRLLEVNGTAYMVMEFVHGQSMADWMRSHPKPKEDLLRAILFPLLDGLESVHRKNVLHRDISPENILITADNKPALLDFGSARTTVDKDKKLTGVVRAGYSPIEQYQTDAPQGAYTDIYALAGVMVHAITGHTPPLSMDRCGAEDTFRPLAQRYRGKYTKPFLRALDAAFSISPKDRPQSVAEWRQMLGGGFVPAKPQPQPKPPKPSPTKVETKLRERKTTTRVEPAPPRRGVVWLSIVVSLALVAGGVSLYYVLSGTPTGNDTKGDSTLATNLVEAKSPKDLTKGGVYTNSLGMKFVTVPGTSALFCVNQTRRKDYAAYAHATARVNGDWENVAWNNVPVSREANSPVVMVSWDDANAFCKWLSESDSKALGFTVTYRLPTWEEWRAARGSDKYPWGSEDTPPTGAGNFADQSARRAFGSNFAAIPNYDDGFATTSPVGSFKPNKNGLFDVGSNIVEWSSDRDISSGEMRVLGASWKDAGIAEMALKDNAQYHESADTRRPFIGFRCVLLPPGK